MAHAGDVQAAVDHLARSLGQSVLIEDDAQRPVWWSTTGAVDGTRTRTILDRRVDARAASVVTKYKLRTATAPVHTPAIPGADMWARWCMPVRRDNSFLGLLWVLDPDKTIGEDDLPALVECAEVAAEVMASTRSSSDDGRRRRDELLTALLAGRDRAAAAELVAIENLSSDACVQVDLPARPGGWLLPRGASAHIARSRRRNATSGAPLPLLDLAEATRRAVLTRRAISAGAVLDRASWDALGAWRLIVETPTDVQPDNVHPAVSVLAAQPRSQLLDTARIILDLGGDVTASAAALHVHRTTLYYRLDRIAALTGIDLRQGTGRTDLQLALWLAAYREVKGAEASYRT